MNTWIERLTKWLKSPVNASPENSLAYKEGRRKRKRYSHHVQQLQYPVQAEIGQDKLRHAINAAENPHHPDRYMLLQIYKHIMRDLHLKSQIRTAIYKVVSTPFEVLQAGVYNEGLTRLLQSKWFEDCCKYYLQAEFWGFSLIEFQPLKETEMGKTVDKVVLMPREHVRPESHEILLNPRDSKGIDYTMKPLDRVYLPAGDPHDLGLLCDAAKYVIYKNYALSDWARSSEKWGDPMLVIQSASDDEEENREKAEAAANFGNNSWMLADDQDKVSLLERNAQGSAHLIYRHLKDDMDQENSKGVNGQVATSDEKSYVGSAEVQERLLNDYTLARLRGLYYWVNKELFPFLAKMKGTPYEALAGAEWKPILESKPEPAKEGEGGGKSLGYRYQPRWK